MKTIKIIGNYLFVTTVTLIALNLDAFAMTFKDKNLFRYSYNSSIKKISNQNLKRLENFLSGNFYSYQQNNFQKNVHGAYFALSETGTTSVLSYCVETIEECILDNAQFITKKKCERISNEKCFIILSQNTLVMNNNKYIIENNLNENKKYFETFISKKNKTSDIRLESYREREQNSDYN